MGIPCAHAIRQIPIGQEFRMVDFHVQWWLTGRQYAPVDEPDRYGLGIDPVVTQVRTRYDQLAPAARIQLLGELGDLLDEPRIGIQNPQLVRTRGRSQGSTNRASESSTRREPSQFEVGQRRQRLCGKCRQAGHYSSTCPNSDQ